MDVKNLIDNAARNVHGKAALARELGVSAQTVSAWYAGRKAVPVDVRAILADIGNRSAASELATAALERAKGKPFYDRLSAALKKSAVGAVAMLLGFAGNDASSFAGTPTPTHDNV